MSTGGEPLSECIGADGGRFPLLEPAQLSATQRALHTAIAGPPRDQGPFLIADGEGRLAGPFNALLYAPEIGHAVQALGAALRFGGALPARTRELVICLIAAKADSAYEWYAHSRVAAEAGISADELAELQSGRVPATLDPAEDTAVRFAARLVDSTTMPAELHAETREHFGHSGVTELSVLVGYYRLLAGLLAAGNVPAPTDHHHTTITTNEGENP